MAMAQKNPDNTAPGGGDAQRPSGREQRLQAHLAKALALKNYAITNAIDVPEAVITDLNAIEGLAEQNNVASEAAKFDIAVAKLTAATYPVTVANISPTTDGETVSYARFKKVLLVAAVIVLVVVVLLFTVAKMAAGADPESWLVNVPGPLFHSLLSIGLGFLGAVVFGLFYVLKVVPQQVFDVSDEFSNYARFLVGGLLGWFVYFAMVQEYFTQAFGPDDPDMSKIGIWLMLPFLVGYSSSLAVGILNKMLKAVEITLGLEDRRELAFTRRKQPK